MIESTMDMRGSKSTASTIVKFQVSVETTRKSLLAGIRVLPMSPTRLQDPIVLINTKTAI